MTADVLLSYLATRKADEEVVARIDEISGVDPALVLLVYELEDEVLCDESGVDLVSQVLIGC